jgi:O-antigen/teichoic acid export membrane protein
MAFKLLSAIQNRHFHSLLGNLVTAFLSLLSYAILLRILPPSEFGEWVLCLSTFNILDQIRTALLQSGIIKFYAGADELTARNVSGAAWYISILLTAIYLLLSLAVLATAYSHLNDTWRFFLSWLGWLTVISIPFNIASWILQAKHLFNKITHIRLLQNGCYLLFICLLHYTGHATVHNVLYSYAAGLAVTSIYCLVCGWTEVRTLAVRSRERIRELFHYGRVIVGSMVFSAFISYSDNFLLRAFLSPTAVAIYSLPQKFMEAIEIILRSFIATAQPTLSAAANRGDKRAVMITFCKYTGLVTLMILPLILLLVAFTHPLIVILAKKEVYLGATDVVRIFLISAILWPLDRFLGVTLDMINRPLINFYKTLLKLAVNVTASCTLLYFFREPWGAAVASTLNVIAGAVFGYFFLRKFVPFQLADIWRYGFDEFVILLNKILFRLQWNRK